MSLTALTEPHSTPSALASASCAARISLACCCGHVGEFVGSGRVDQRAFAIERHRIVGFGEKEADLGRVSLAKAMARFTVSDESCEPSVGTRICLNMEMDPLVGEISLAY
jgi:hypothetical protein